jgi:pyocin large subunit-like protein
MAASIGAGLAVGTGEARIAKGAYDLFKSAQSVSAATRAGKTIIEANRVFNLAKESSQAITKISAATKNSGLFVQNAVKKEGVDVGRQIWSSTNKKTSVQNAFKHWKDHKNEFPELFNAKQYVERSHSLFQHSEKTLTKIRSNGEILYYQPTSNTFGAFTKDGVPKTMFRPRDGIYYWETRS